MARTPERKGLGRGLSALMAEIEPQVQGGITGAGSADSENPARRVPIEHIHPNPDQPRKSFDQPELEGLAASIREKGVIQPLIVRPDPAESSRFQLVAGERRWRAAQLAQQHDVPVLVRELSDIEVLEIAIVENVQRADLNPLEEAQGYRQLVDRFGHTQEQLAQAMGKSRSHLANLMRLLQLPTEIQDLVRSGQLSAGHARALLTAEDPISLALRAVRQGLSVRDVEKAARKTSGDPNPGRDTGVEKDADTRALESDLSAALGMRVSINHNSDTNHGILSINYNDLPQLDDLMRLLGGGNSTHQISN